MLDGAFQKRSETAIAAWVDATRDGVGSAREISATTNRRTRI